MPRALTLIQSVETNSGARPRRAWGWGTQCSPTSMLSAGAGLLPKAKPATQRGQCPQLALHSSASSHHTSPQPLWCPLTAQPRTSGYRGGGAARGLPGHAGPGVPVGLGRARASRNLLPLAWSGVPALPAAESTTPPGQLGFLLQRESSSSALGGLSLRLGEAPGGSVTAALGTRPSH